MENYEKVRFEAKHGTLGSLAEESLTYLNEMQEEKTDLARILLTERDRGTEMYKTLYAFALDLKEHKESSKLQVGIGELIKYTKDKVISFYTIVSFTCGVFGRDVIEKDLQETIDPRVTIENIEHAMSLVTAKVHTPNLN